MAIGPARSPLARARGPAVARPIDWAPSMSETAAFSRNDLCVDRSSRPPKDFVAIIFLHKCRAPMSRMNLSKLSAPLALAALLGAPVGALAQQPEPRCPVGAKSCSVGSYQHIAKSDPCAKGLKTGTCRANPIAPDMPEFVCFPSSPNAIDCEVWPQGQDFSYYFSTQGSIRPSVQGATPFPYISFYCRDVWSSGTTHVWVTSPSGVSSYKSIEVSCRVDGWLE
jgi:hypothetical protein